jgi:hypothetical protein
MNISEQLLKVSYIVSKCRMIVNHFEMVWNSAYGVCRKLLPVYLL